MKKNPLTISFLQGLGLAAYVSLVGAVLWRGDEWFGPANNFLGPVLVLSLLVASALICGGMALAYPLYLALEKKRTKEAIRIVVYTTLWVLIFFTALALVNLS